MCLILFAVEASPELSLLVAANRDEFYGRPTALATPWPDAPEVIGGRDLREGGSWLGITRKGRWAAVTNFREPSSIRLGAPSRGHLVSDFLQGDFSPAEYLDSLRPHVHRYNGFNLLVGDSEEVLWFSNRAEDHPLLALPLPPGVYGLSNHLLDTPWPKVERGKGDLARALSSGVGPEGLIEILLDRTLAEDADLPRTGVALDQERALSARFIAGSEYGTRSSTIVQVRRAGEILLLERSFEPPARVHVTRHEFTRRL